jgi:hypothetical protein
VTVNDAGSYRVSAFKDGRVEDAALLHGRPCGLASGSREGLPVSRGEVPYFITGNETMPVLMARSGNWFWHTCAGGFTIKAAETSGTHEDPYVLRALPNSLPELVAMYSDIAFTHSRLFRKARWFFSLVRAPLPRLRQWLKPV